MSGQEELDALREKAAQVDAAEHRVEALSAEVAALQKQVEGLRAQNAKTAEVQQEVGVFKQGTLHSGLQGESHLVHSDVSTQALRTEFTADIAM